ncbi:MAG: hypothetical protein HZB46_01845 [Solirubrobacterales bacterium]|nr:hypothetical protein [Solirubrobacterales bacterium]
MTEEAHLRIDALHRRIQHLEDHLRQIHEHVGMGPMPERPAPAVEETEGVRRLLAEGKEQEALRLHRDLTGQGNEEARAALEQLRGSF